MVRVVQLKLRIFKGSKSLGKIRMASSISCLSAHFLKKPEYIIPLHTYHRIQNNYYNLLSPWQVKPPNVTLTTETVTHSGQMWPLQAFSEILYSINRESHKVDTINVH